MVQSTAESVALHLKALKELRLTNPEAFNNAFFADQDVWAFLQGLWNPQKSFQRRLMEQGVPEACAMTIVDLAVDEFKK